MIHKKGRWEVLWENVDPLIIFENRFQLNKKSRDFGKKFEA